MTTIPNPTYTVHLTNSIYKIGTAILQTIIPEYALEIAANHPPHPDYDNISIVVHHPNSAPIIYTRAL